jgi:hypothetical protein
MSKLVFALAGLILAFIMPAMSLGASDHIAGHGDKVFVDATTPTVYVTIVNSETPAMRFPLKGSLLSEVGIDASVNKGESFVLLWDSENRDWIKTVCAPRYFQGAVVNNSIFAYQFGPGTQVERATGSVTVMG